MSRIQRKTNLVALALLLLVGSFVASVGWFNLGKLYEAQAVAADSKPVEVVQIGETKLTISNWSLFETGQIWSVATESHKIPDSYTPALVDSPVAFTGETMKIGVAIVQPLSAMVAKAASDGVNLMLSSGYRSAEDQASTYDFYASRQGESYARNFVAAVGLSEHQTGLAVDLADLSNQCKASGASCSLNRASIDWLRNNAASFGFIERYQAGKQSITGISGEHWHYRFVGVPLAKALTAADLTLDEFVAQTAPGYK